MNLLIERCLSGDNSWEALALNDAIDIARRLHPSALAAVTVNLTLSRATPQLMGFDRDVEVVSSQFAKLLKPQVRKLPSRSFEWDYLSEARVATFRVNPTGMADVITTSLIDGVEDAGNHYCSVGDFLGELGVDEASALDRVKAGRLRRSLQEFAGVGSLDVEYDDDDAFDESLGGKRSANTQLLSERLEFHRDWRSALQSSRHHDLADELHARRLLGMPRTLSKSSGGYDEWYAEYRRQADKIAQAVEKWAARYWSDALSLFLGADRMWDDLAEKWMETPLGDIRLTTAGVVIGHANLMRLNSNTTQLSRWLRAN